MVSSRSLADLFQIAVVLEPKRLGIDPPFGHGAFQLILNAFGNRLRISQPIADE